MKHVKATSSQLDTTYVAQVQLSIIIPSYNAAQLIGQQLEALAKQQFSNSWEVIVADNGSIDLTNQVVEQFKSWLPHLRIINASDCKGASYARNVGAQFAKGEYIVFVDADDVVAPGFLEAMADALTRHDFVAPRLEARLLNTHWAADLGEHPQYNGLKRYYNAPYLYYAGGCGLGIRRSVFLSLGGFDISVRHLEDSEFCFRAQLAGIDLAFAPAAMIHVRNRASLRGMLRQSRQWGGAEVQLALRYRGRVSPQRTLILWMRYLARWLKLFFKLTLVRSRIDLIRLAQEAARQIGILTAAILLGAAPV